MATEAATKMADFAEAAKLTDAAFVAAGGAALAAGIGVAVTGTARAATATAAKDGAAATATVGEAEAKEEAIPSTTIEAVTTSAAGEETWLLVSNAASAVGARTGPV